MNYLIGLNSFNLFEPSRILEFQHGELSYDALFSMDKTMREAVASNPFAEWGDMESSLAKVGFSTTEEDGRTVFWHSRQWDEHLTAFAESFWVTFPQNAPMAVAGKVVLATNYPALFALLPDKDIQSQTFLLVTGDNEAIYPNDKLWINQDSDLKTELGPVTVIEDQFPSKIQFTRAQQHLINAGYTVSK